jgi:RNA polymerase sigma factor (sigma-70 family)
MNGGRLRGVIRGLRRAVGPAGGGGLTDADLLRRWVAGRDEGAFEALLWRHAAAVLGVCRRVLGDAHEAEDAAQATFLTLARKAAAIGRRQAVAAWLYSVAYRAALRAQSRRPRTVVQSPRDLGTVPARPDEDPAWRDLRPVLDEEIGRLPAKYRAPFVLCHVEGRTNEEAARELGCPVGTVLSRLARARQRLRARLTRRGVTLTAAALAAALAGESAAAAVPGVLVRGAVRAAVLAAAGKGLAGVVSTEVVALTEGVVRAMLLTKVKVAGAVVLGLVLLGGGGGALTYRTAAGEPGGAPQVSGTEKARQRPAASDADKLKAMLAQKEKEVRALQDRLAELEVVLKDKTRQLEVTLQQQRDQTQRARAAEEEARRQADKERELRNVFEAKARSDAEVARAHEDQNRTSATAASRAEQAEQAKDEVELLEAQLAIKKAQLEAVRGTYQAAEQAVRTGAAPVSEAATQKGQLLIKEAEVKEAQVRLRQAQRRLARLSGPAAPARDAQRPQLDQRATDLEKKLDALKKELDGLRKEMQEKRPGPARSE